MVFEFEGKTEKEAIDRAAEELGVGRDEFRGLTGFDYEALCGPAIDRLVAAGLLERAPDRLRLADAALFVSDAVFRELV